MDGTTHNVTRGRAKRKRKPGSGRAVGIKRHTRTPRGPNSGKSKVVVDGYKRGKPKRDGSDRVQLCAQALCLEEMLGATVPAGAIFYGVTRRREEVVFDDALRTLMAVSMQSGSGAARTSDALDLK